MNNQNILEEELSVRSKMDEEKKQMMYKLFYRVCSAAATIGVPYVSYVVAKHIF